MVISHSESNIEVVSDIVKESQPLVTFLLHPESTFKEQWFLPPGSNSIPDSDQILLRSTESAIVGPSFKFDLRYFSNQKNYPTIHNALLSMISQYRDNRDNKFDMVNQIIDSIFADGFEELEDGVSELKVSVKLDVVIKRQLGEQDLGNEKVARWIQEYQGFVEKLRLEENQSDRCAICLEDMLAGSDVGRTICLHLFHVECLKPWLRKSLSCPLCRFKFSGVDRNPAVRNDYDRFVANGQLSFFGYNRDQFVEDHFLGTVGTDFSRTAGADLLGMATIDFSQMTMTDFSRTTMTDMIGRGRFVGIGQDQFIRNDRGQFVRNEQNPFIRNRQDQLIGNGRSRFVRNRRDQFIRNYQGRFLRNGRGRFIRNGQGRFFENSRGRFFRNDRGRFVENNQGQFLGNEWGQFVENGHDRFVGNSRGRFVGNDRGQFFGNNRERFLWNGQERFFENDHERFFRNGHDRFFENTQDIFVRNARIQFVESAWDQPFGNALNRP